MNNLETITAAGVRRLPEAEGFLPNHKINRTAFTAFWLSFFKTLKDLSRSEKRKYIRREMRIDDGYYNDLDVDYSDDKVIDINEDYDSMFPPTQRRWNGHVLAACMRKARDVFDSFSISVLSKWNKRADQLNKIPVSGQFEEPPTVLLGDLRTMYSNHLFHDTLYCFKQIRRYITAGYDRQNTQRENWLARNNTAITIGTYVYIKELFVPSLLKLVLFGNNYNYIDMVTVIFESAAKLVVHLPSAVQLNE